MKGVLSVGISCLCLWMAAGNYALAVGSAPVRETVIVDYFSRVRKVTLDDVAFLRGGVLAGFMERGRHNIIDAERILQMAVNALPGVMIDPLAWDEMCRKAVEYRAEIIGSLEARYMVTGLVTDCQVKNENTSWSVAYALRLMSYDLSTGRYTAPEEIQVVGSGNSVEAADQAAMKSFAGRMENYINNHFKFQTEILRMEEPVNGKWKELYIHCGTAIGVRKGDLFKVYLESEIDGVPMTRQIGKLRAKEVAGEEVTRCVISNGGEEIAEAFAENKRLIVVSDGQALF